MVACTPRSESHIFSVRYWDWVLALSFVPTKVGSRRHSIQFVCPLKGVTIRVLDFISVLPNWLEGGNWTFFTRPSPSPATNALPLWFTALPTENLFVIRCVCNVPELKTLRYGMIHLRCALLWYSLAISHYFTRVQSRFENKNHEAVFAISIPLWFVFQNIFVDVTKLSIWLLPFHWRVRCWKVMPGLGSWRQLWIDKHHCKAHVASTFAVGRKEEETQKNQAWNAVLKGAVGQTLKGGLKTNSISANYHGSRGLEARVRFDFLPF